MVLASGTAGRGTSRRAPVTTAMLALERPKPRTARAQPRRTSLVRVPAKRNGTVASAHAMVPATAMRRAPILSTTRPTGRLKIAPSPCGARSRPAVRASAPRTSW